MPGIDGWRFCRLLRSSEYKKFNQIPVLVVSATFSGEEPGRITSGMGANAFLPSPVDGRRFTDLARQLLAGQVPLAHWRLSGLVATLAAVVIGMLAAVAKSKTFRG